MKILLADDSKTTRSLLTKSLQEMGHVVVTAINGQEAIALFQKECPDLIILDVVMSGMSGFECAKNIRAISTDNWIPIIFLSGSVDDESIAKGIDAGGDDYLTKPFSEVTLAAKIKAMQRISDMRKELFETTQQLMILSSTDPLTKTYNRFQFNKTIVEKIAQSKRYNRKMAVFFLDLDKFKLINDTLGHHIGDLLLIEVTQRLKSCLRTDDFIARLGGDEFAIIFSDLAEYSKAEEVAQKIIEVLFHPYSIEGHRINSSLSIGIACYPKDGLDHHELLKNADVAMYHAKKLGRNNYQCFNKTMIHVMSTEESNSEPLSEFMQSQETNHPHKCLILNCCVNNTHVCMDLRFIKKTVPLAQLKIMPNAPYYLVGLLNLAQKSVPIIDLGAWLNLPRENTYSLNTPIVLCSDGFNEVGLLVDSILGLEEIEAEKYSNKPTSIILATPTIGSELSLLINMELLLTTEINSQNNLKIEMSL